MSVTSSPILGGLAPTADVEAYLTDVANAPVTGLGRDRQVRVGGNLAPASWPVAQTFWLESTEAVGSQTIVWPVEDECWTLVAMNADGGLRSS